MYIKRRQQWNCEIDNSLNMFDPDCCGNIFPYLVDVYCVIYLIGALINLPLLFLISDCNYYEPAAEVVRVNNLDIVDTSAPCEYVIQWTPLYTPPWSFVPHKLDNPVHDTIRLRCPPDVSSAPDERTLYVDGCYSNPVFGTHPTFVHKSNFDDYDIASILWFRISELIAVSPLIIFLVVTASIALRTLATTCYWRARECYGGVRDRWIHRWQHLRHLRNPWRSEMNDCELGNGDTLGKYVRTGTREDGVI